MKERQSGVLMHISSLPGKYGIGSFGKSAYDFVDFLVRTKQRYWQILPLGTTSYGDSPYQSFSAFAGNTHFIDFDRLIEEGLLVQSDLEGLDFGQDPRKVDYAKVFNNRRPVLEKAVKRFLERGDLAAYEKFVADNASWLEVFVEYMAIKEYFDLIVSGEDFAESKPNPAIYQVILEKLDINVGNAVAIENSFCGIAAA